MNFRSLLHPKQRAQIELRRLAEFRARQALKRHPQVWAWLHDYLAKTESTGCSYHDYWALYRHVRQQGAREILECGTGVSTLVLAAACLDNEREGVPAARLTSMEDQESWLEMSRKLLPDELQRFVDFTLSPRLRTAFPCSAACATGRCPSGLMTSSSSTARATGRPTAP